LTFRKSQSWPRLKYQFVAKLLYLAKERKFKWDFDNAELQFAQTFVVDRGFLDTERKREQEVMIRFLDDRPLHGSELWDRGEEMSAIQVKAALYAVGDRRFIMAALNTALKQDVTVNTSNW
jgi:hypothetical protein